jgi:urease accessory protein
MLKPDPHCSGQTQSPIGDRPLTTLLHLCDSLFPIGGFAHSDGLEAAAVSGRVTSAGDLRDWIEVVLSENLERVEGPVVWLAWQASAARKWNDLAVLDDEAYAIRPSSTGRAASRAMGTRLIRTWRHIHPDSPIDVNASPSTFPVAFGVVCAGAGIPARAAVEGFIYTRLSATVSAAMRLIPIGQREAHTLLAATLQRVPTVVDTIATATTARFGAFSPGFDLAAMEQQYVRSRLFLS